MIAVRNTPETDSLIKRNGGVVWNRLHSEREDICDALLKESGSDTVSDVRKEPFGEEITRTAFWHRELLQARLRKLDDALDRLLSGSYGNCSKCGRWIEDTKLEFDPAIAFCVDCWQRIQDQDRTELLKRNRGNQPILSTHGCCPSTKFSSISPSPDGVALETLAPFDTISVRTRNSDYRVFLLDPRTGRALVQGGKYFPEPVAAMMNGSTFGSFTLKEGWIGIGLRMEFEANGKITSTSPVESFHVEHPAG